MRCPFKRFRSPVIPPRSTDGGCDVLFILKRREAYGVVDETPSQSTGLWNSASYAVDMLNDLGFSAAIEIAIDNNCIDRLVTLHRPRIVVIEALWVVPEKFDQLIPLHPGVQWCVRIHSEMPFMAGEAVALNWLHRYMAHPEVSVGVNAARMARDLSAFLGVATFGEASPRIHYLPNAYPEVSARKAPARHKYWVDIGCFGAVRPLKNHVTQAIAAIDFAMANDKQLRFHINAAREEMNGGPVLANLRGMFASLARYGHQLVEHEWLPRDDFLDLCATMDLGLQVSLSETFNIVGADMTAAGVPLVGSSEIPWLTGAAVADPTDATSITAALQFAWTYPHQVVRGNAAGLTASMRDAREAWSGALATMTAGPVGVAA